MTTTVAELLHKAELKSGLDDWGQVDIIEPLSLYLESVEQSANLHDRGWLMLRNNVLRLLQNRLHLVEAFGRGDAESRSRLWQPLVIVGLPRTGSTLLHRLLACDPASRALRYFEGLHPLPPLAAGSRAADRRQKTAARRLALLNKMNPELQRIHATEVDDPEECAHLMEHSFVDSMFELRTTVSAYSTWLRSEELRPVYYKELEAILGVLGLGDHDRWVLKAPRHLPCLATLIGVVPSAQIVWTHRDPTESIPSMCSLAAVVQGTSSDHVNRRDLGAFWLDRLAEGHERAVETRRTDRADRYVDVEYRRLVKEPLTVVAEIYDHFGYRYTAEFESAMVSWLEGNKQNRHGRHRYTAEGFGLTTDQITERIPR